MMKLLVLIITLAPIFTNAIQKRAACDGCYSLDTAYNTKYVRPTETDLFLVGRLVDPENCVINWFRGVATPLVTITKYAIDWHTPDVRFAANMAGHFWIKKLKRPLDEGIWKAIVTCKNFTEGSVYLTRIFFADVIKSYSGSLFDSFATPPDVIYKTNYTITQDGHSPACFRTHYCSYLPESDQLVFDFFTMEDTGIWVLNYTLQNGNIFTKVLGLNAKVPRECFGSHLYEVGETLDPYWQKKGHDLLYWFKQENETSPIMHPLCFVKGGHTKQVIDKDYQCNFDGTLSIPKDRAKCGRYWSFSFSGRFHTVPAHIRAFYVRCPVTSPLPFMCLPTGSYGRAGHIMTPYPDFSINNSISLWLYRNTSGAFKQLCYAKKGYTVWENPQMQKCYLNGSMVPSSKYCSSVYSVYSVTIPTSLQHNDATMLHHVIGCDDPSRKKRAVIPMFQLVARYSPPNSSFPPIPELLYGINVTSLESDNDFNASKHIVAKPLNSSQYIVISTFNSSTIAVLSAFLLILFFLGVWLVCMYKRGKIDHNPTYAPPPPEYDLKSPIYTEMK